MLKYILFTLSFLFANSELNAWIDKELLYRSGKKSFEELRFEDATNFYFLLLDQAPFLTPNEKIRYGSSALEMLTPTHQWSSIFTVLDHCTAALPEYEIQSKDDSLVLGTFLFRIGEIAGEYGIPSRNIPIRQKGIDFLANALSYLPPDDPIQVYALVQSGHLKRLMQDRDGAYQDFSRAKKLVKTPISKANMRVHQGLGVFFHAKARNDIYSLTRAREHIDSAKVIAELIDNEEPKDVYKQGYYSADLSGKIMGNHTLAKIQLLEIDEYAKNYPYKDHFLYLCESKLGLLCYREGQYVKAIGYDTKAFNGMDPACYKPDRLVSKLLDIGTGYYAISEFDKSLIYQYHALDFLREKEDENTDTYLKYAARANNNIASSLPDSTKSQIVHLEKAMHLLQEIPNFEDDEEIVLNIASIQANLGYCYAYAQDDLGISNQHYTQVISTLENHSPSSPSIAKYHAALALNFIETDHQEAIRQIRIAENFNYGKDPDKVSVAEAYIGIGDAFLQLGEFDPSIKYFRKGLDALVADSISLAGELPPVEEIIERNLGLSALQGIGIALQNMGIQNSSPEIMQKSYLTFQKAIEMSHMLRQQQTAQISQVSLANRTRNLYESSIGIAIDLHKNYPEAGYLAEAFALAEQSRGLVLLAAISSNDAAESAGVPDSILLHQKELQIRYDSLQRKKAKTKDLREIEEMNAKMIHINEEQDRITNFLQTNYEEFYLQVYETATTPIETIQEDLATRNAGMIEFFYGDSILFTFALTPDTLIVQQERITPDFTNRLGYIQETQVDQILEEWGDRYWKDGWFVYNALLGDLGIDLPANLLIIPDGRLNYLSFDALISEPFNSEFTNTGYHELPYLLFQKVISYDYSYTIRKRRHPYEFTESVSLLAMAPSFEHDSTLPSLPKSEENIEKLGHEYRYASTLVGEMADINSFRTEASKHTIVDLATHGEMDPVNSADCRLHFYPDSSGNGMLHLGEIYNLNLDIRMAVLEACESGLGPDARGEGVMSLARGFSYAGCRTIVTSLWNVAEADITTEIFNRFYHHLSEKTSVDSALTLAKRDFLLENRKSPGHLAHYYKPFFWSEMIVIGDTSPIPIEKVSKNQPNSITYAVGAFILLITIAFIAFRLRKRKNTSE